MNAFAASVFASLPSHLGYQMARSPVLPAFATHLGALPEFIGVIVTASTIAGVFLKPPSGALSEVLGRKRMMVGTIWNSGEAAGPILLWGSEDRDGGATPFCAPVDEDRLLGLRPVSA